MKLYHIRLIDKNYINIENNTIYYSRIPENVMNGEDSNIPRVCFSDSIEGCFSSINMLSTMRHNVTFDENTHIQILSIDTDNIDSSLIKDYKTLDQLGLVPDAYLTHEHWFIGTMVKMKSEGLFTIKHVEFDRISTLPNIERYQYCDEPCSIEVSPKGGCGCVLNIFTKVELVPLSNKVYNPLSNYIITCSDEEGLVVKNKRTALVEDNMWMFRRF